MDERTPSIHETSGSNDELFVWLVTRGGALRLERTEAESRSSFAETGSEFVWSPRPDDRVALRLRNTASFLSVLGTGQLTLSEAEVDSAPAFDVVEAEGGPGLRLAGADRLLSVRLDEGTDTQAPLFVEFRGLANDQSASLLGCCCGPRSRDSSETGALWDDHTHYAIVQTAVEKVLGELSGQAELVKRMYELWKSDRWGFPFKEVAQHAMRQADYTLPWARERVLGQFFYNDHFYDPQTGRNWQGEESSAVTVGAATFDESVRLWKDRKFQSSAQWLGTSLHFLTDLTQPMHAANFTNIHRPYVAHSGFEKYAEDKVGRGRYFANYPAGHIRDLDITHYTAKDFILEVARRSKSTFVSMMKDFLERNERVFNPTWPPEVADRCLTNSLWLAPRIVARYLILWAFLVGLGQSAEGDHES